MISTNDFHTGVTIEYEGDIYNVLEFQHVKPGKGNAFVRSKLKNLRSGAIIDKTFRAGEKLARAHLERKEMEYLYREDNFFHVMDMESYEQITISRAFIQKDDFKQLTYYWFPQRGRILNSMIEMKLFNFWDALTRQRTDGALVRLVTPVTEGETIDQADQRLQVMTRQLQPLLEQYLPGKDR